MSEQKVPHSWPSELSSHTSRDEAQRHEEEHPFAHTSGLQNSHASVSGQRAPSPQVLPEPGPLQSALQLPPWHRRSRRG